MARSSVSEKVGGSYGLIRSAEEYAVNVATVTIALNDAFHLDDFEEKRQGLLSALVACSPRNVAP